MLQNYLDLVIYKKIKKRYFKFFWSLVPGLVMKPIVLTLWKKIMWIFNHKPAEKIMSVFVAYETTQSRCFFPSHYNLKYHVFLKGRISQFHRDNAKIWSNHWMIRVAMKKKIMVLLAKFSRSPYKTDCEMQYTGSIYLPKVLCQ